MRIAKFIANSGFCSRREAERVIVQGRVSVDGKIIDSPALNISEDSEVIVDGKKIANIQAPRMWVFYKPNGYITTHSDPQGRETIFELLKDKLPRVISVGRLDLNSEGLLLLTNNGDVARYLESPKSRIKRVYKVRAYGGGRPLDIKDKKIVVDGVYYHPDSIKLLSQKGSNSWYEVILREGKNREIRKIFAHFGFKVNRLIRTSFGEYELGILKPGEFKEAELPDLQS